MDKVTVTEASMNIAKFLFEHEMKERGVVASWEDVCEEDRAGWQKTVNVILHANREATAPSITIPSGCKITALSPTGAMIEAAERQGYTPYSAREVWMSMHIEAPHIRAYGRERGGVCGCIAGSDGEPLGGPCENCAARLTTPAPDSEKLREAEFNRGYMLAVANLMNLHGDEVQARDMLGELGASRADMEALDLTDYDLIPLRRLFDEIERRAALGASL